MPNPLQRRIESAWAAHGRRLYGFALSILCSREDAEDALQEVFLGLVRAGDRLDDVRELRPYLYRAVRNEAVRLVKRRKEPTDVSPESLPLLVAAPQRRVDEAADLSRALASLPVEQREAVVLKLYHGLTFDEIAAIAGLSPNTAASRYRYGVEKLRKALSTRGEVAQSGART